MPFATFSVHIFLLFETEKGNFTQVFSKKLTNFKRKAIQANVGWIHQPSRLHWPAGRQKLSGCIQSSLEMLKARWFFGQPRLSSVGEADVGAGTAQSLCCTCPAALEQHPWAGTQGDFTLPFASAEPHSQPTQQCRPGASGQAGNAASVQCHTEVNVLHMEKSWALGSQRHILPSRHLLTPAGTVCLSDTTERANLSKQLNNIF